MNQMNRSRPKSITLHLLSANKRVAVAIFEILGDDHDQVNQGPDAAASKRQQLRHANTGLFRVKAMYPQPAQEEAQEQGSKPIIALNAIRAY